MLRKSSPILIALTVCAVATVLGLYSNSDGQTYEMPIKSTKPHFPLTFSGPPRFETEYDWIIARTGTDVYARHGTTGRIVYRGATLTPPALDDAGAVINAVISSLDPDRGGSLYIKTGTYPVETRIDIVDRRKVRLVGEPGAVLTASVGAAILIDGTCTDTTRTWAEGDSTIADTDPGVGEILIEGLSFRDCVEKGINIKRGDDITIRDCTFVRMGTHAIQGHIFTESESELACVLRRLRIENNYVYEAGLDLVGPGATASIYLYFVEDSHIIGNRIERSGNVGMLVSRTSRRVVIANNVFKDSDCNRVPGQGHGLYVASGEDGTTNVSVIGNQMFGNGGNGIEALSPPTVGNRMLIADNVLSGNGHSNLDDSPTGWRNGMFVVGDHVIVTGNLITDSYGTGLKIGLADRARDILVQSNTISNSGLGGSTNIAWASGIVCNGLPEPDDCVLIDCIPRDQRILIVDNHVTDGAGNQLAAIHGRADADGLRIVGNLVDGDTGPLIDIDPAANYSVIARNHGFATEANGAVEVEDLDTDGSDDATVVAHGLDVTPELSDVQVTATTSLSGRDLWISDVTSTSFTVNVSDGDGGTDPTVKAVWSAVVR